METWIGLPACEVSVGRPHALQLPDGPHDKWLSVKDQAACLGSPLTLKAYVGRGAIPQCLG